MPAWKCMHLITRHFCLIGRLSLGLLTISLLTVGSSSMAKVITTTKNVEIGDNVVRVRSYETKGLPILFVALHDNENTGIRAAHNAINAYGGRLIELRAINQRWIPFNVGERRVLFDPNWMFSVSGVKRSLRDYRVYSLKACRMVTSFSRRIIEELDVDSFKVVVSLHNNTDGHFSILSYGRKGRYASQVRKLHISEHSDVDDFFLVTDINMFRYIKMKNYNVVLVKKHVVAGDGSLMGYSVERDVDYLNIEAQHLHFSKQREMINLVIGFYQIEANRDNEHIVKQIASDEVGRLSREMQDYNGSKSHIRNFDEDYVTASKPQAIPIDCDLEDRA